MPSTQILNRASNACELCSATSDVHAVAVPPYDELSLDYGLAVCGTCADQLAADAVLDADHLRCLQDSAWSQEPAVQVVAWRLLSRLDASWATGLLGQIYLSDEVLTWAKNTTQDGGGSSAGDAPTLDSNGTALNEGDSVTLIKDLTVKGAGFTAKRGTMVRRIRLTDDPAHIEGKVNGTQIVLKTCFLKRVG